MKEKIMEIINTNPMVKQIYENSEGCFRNAVVPSIEICDDNIILESVIVLLAAQAEIYDVLLYNIATFGNEELIKKCNEDIRKFTSGE